MSSKQVRPKNKGYNRRKGQNGARKKQQRSVVHRRPNDSAVTKFMLGAGGITKFRCTQYNYLANVGSLYNSQRYAMNNGYNLASPSSGSLFPVGNGITETIYNSMRVENFSITVRFRALETFPMECGTTPSTTDLGVNYSLLIPGTQQRWGRHRPLSAKTGQDSCVLKSSIHLRNLLGDMIYETDPGYVGNTTGTAPTKLLYFNFGTLSTNNTVSGVEYANDIRVTIKWFNQDFQYSFDRPLQEQMLYLTHDGFTTSKPSVEAFPLVVPVPASAPLLKTSSAKDLLDSHGLRPSKYLDRNNRSIPIDGYGNPYPFNHPDWPGHGTPIFHQNCTCLVNGPMCLSHSLCIPWLHTQLPQFDNAPTFGGHI
jgi:hypothetical protein